MKETHRTFAHSGMGGLLLWLLILTACVGEELQKPILGEGEGYLRLQVAPVSAEITTSPLTKAEIPTEQIPKPNQCAIKITNKSTDKSTSYANSDALPNPLVLKAGVTYTVEAYHGENNTLQETPYFHGSSEVTIQPNQSNDVTITASLANAMLVPVVNNDLKKHYSEWTLSVKAGSSSQNLASNSMERYLYVQSGLPIEITFSGTNLINGSTSKTAKVTDAAQPRTQYTIQCNPENLPNFTLETKATATHTSAGGYLNGTEVTLNVASLTGTPHELIKEWDATLKNADGTTVRTYTANSAPTNGSSQIMKVEGNWPYLPQGNYTLSAKLTLMTNETVEAEETTVTVPAPTFSVTASAYTSYNKYHDEKNIAEANACNGSTIYDMKAVPTIAPELLSNANYTQSSELNIGSDKITDPTSKVLSWGAHTLEATYTFDGITNSGSETYHVTGLPFSAVPPKIKGDHAWTYDALDAWNGTDEYARIGNGGAGTTTLQSPYFHVPTDIDIPITISYHSTAVGSYLGGTTFKMYLGGTEIISLSASKNKETDQKGEVKNQTMSSSQNYIKCTNSYSTLNPAHSKVYYVNIYYR